MTTEKKHNDVDAEWIQGVLKAALAADYTALRRFGNQAAKLLSQQGDEKAARAVRALLRRKNAPLQASGHVEAVPRDSNSRLPLVEELTWPTTASLIDRNASN